ncbi:putative benzyl alcohol O-benzoyltransferase [Helianthus annuus]|nr:putative benzyl alcohol O-benzoyltransferase [Helianthus annuus]KAJ0511534.1 putative benzyl alcohol O-benzoyltransferase [Helianthus annuus]
MAQQAPTPLTFTVRRHPPEIIVPAKPTPRELKPLSDIDDQGGLRFNITQFHIYPGNPKMGYKNPASVIRDALAKALVFYYPFAGRLKEGPGKKLTVDCSGQGVLFIEAEADVTLKQFGVELQPPFPCSEELLYDVPGSYGIVDSPLLLIQVTRLLCGGFIFAIRHNHNMCDVFGYIQFITALTEMAQGASTPSTLPIWERELLCARDPPRVTYPHHEFDEVPETDGMTIPFDDMVHRSFFFGPTALRKFVPTHLKNCTTFDVVTACIWRCRTIALQPNPEDDMRLLIIVNARSKFNPPIPVGYYGNVICSPAAISKARDLCNKPLGHTLELVKKAKSEVSEEYVRSVADLMATKGRPSSTTGSYIVSDLTRTSLLELDFGWGKAVYAGPDLPVAGFYTRYINHKGESIIVVPVQLPGNAMKRFAEELDYMLAPDDRDDLGIPEHVATLSKL